jgi:asparagine synthase (glutamine-hydrolysing)
MSWEHRLRDEVFRSIDTIETSTVGVAISGGVDSALLAKACHDAGKNVSLLTIATPGSRDVHLATQLAQLLQLPLFHKVIPQDDLERALQQVISITEFNRLALLENCVCFYYVFTLASELQFDTVLSANGMDELFAGYSLFQRQFSQEETVVHELMRTLISTAKSDKTEIDKLATMFNITYACPFLSTPFVEFALTVPLALKLTDKDDALRKHVVRNVALLLGIPHSTAFQPKKAFQYSSGIHKSIQRLARSRGFTRRNAQHAGYSGAIEAYLSWLTQETSG